MKRTPHANINSIYLFIMKYSISTFAKGKIEILIKIGNFNESYKIRGNDVAEKDF